MTERGEGSVAAVSDRLQRWARLRGTGFAKVVFGSEFARQDCLRRMAGDGIRVEDRMVLVQAGETDVPRRVEEWVRGAGEQGEGVASLVLSGGPGAEFEFRTACGRLSLYRERLGEMGAGLLVWLPSIWSEVFALEVPDFDSWMMLRLELTEAGRALEAGAEERRGGIQLLPEEAIGRAMRAAARARVSEGEKALRAAFEAVRTLESAGLVKEAREMALEFWGLLAGELPRGWRALEARAAIYAAAGDWSRGSAELETALARGVAELGEEDRETLRLAGDLAELLERQGRYAEAEPLLLRALAASEKVMGRMHSDTLTSTNNLALLYTRQGRYGEAEPLFVWALEAREAALGKEHPDTLTAINNLAGLCINQGRYAEGESLFVRALDAREKVLGRDHPNTLTSVNNLAWVYYRQGRYWEAERLYARALEASERTLGNVHPDTLISVSNLALLYESQGRFAEAESLFVRAIQAEESVLGREHPHTLTSVNNLANFYRGQGRYGEAEPLFVRALAVRERMLGREHPNTLTSLNNLAVLYDSQGRFGEAEPLYVRALEASERVLGKEHSNTENVRKNLDRLRERKAT